MIVHRLSIPDHDDGTEEVLGYYTAPDERDRAIVQFARNGSITSAVQTTEIEVTGEPVVIVLVDEHGKLAVGPFENFEQAADCSPEENYSVATWSVHRFGEALVEQIVTAERARVLRRLESEFDQDPDGGYSVRQCEWLAIRAELAGTTS